MDPTPVVVWKPIAKFQDRVWLHVLLFVLTIASTMFAGAIAYAGFIDDFRGGTSLPMPFASLFLRGLWYSGTILAILGCHELGHYFACRYYDVDASLPFFIPVPFLLTGTMGAFIRIRERIPSKRMLFDIGIAGPIAGVGHYLAFRADFVPDDRTVLHWSLVWTGFYYSVTILAILGCHEMGHYLACRYYDVDASLPFFLPIPSPLTGTLGAFIKIREPIPTKRMLFDIGVAGPIAGFAVAVPALIIGISMSHVVRLPADFSGYELGEPLLFKLVAKLLWGTVPEGYSLNMHPIAFAAWFGLLATALNLFPAGQLDGGHISYAVLGRRSTYVTLAMVLCAVGLSFVSTSWIVWTVLMVGMLALTGPRHPPTIDEHIPLDRTRMLVALAALAMFALCFTPAPISPFDLIARP